ncbi:hypothetical protein RUE5091_00044 [Ruegeria denitrificans]|uniref:CENP-V/GFA domain-containing protein n=1 Tax=Ruegeria denitrificans TaxID=1715692 RepID=A0A0P1I0A7_9RHOB|nr:GFA family protein [Ruegeria denitrificans]CUJ82897.1 hypothetical protein RUE5091_00044 [Ruegeria denitrificans]
MTKPQNASGGCLCGNVRYRTDGPLYDLHYCHCRTCQKASGAPAIAGAFLSRDALHFIDGEPKVFRSSPIVERGFCGDCGTYLLYRPLIEEWSDWLIITIASLDNPENYAPKRHYGIESQIPWFDIRDNFPRERYEDGFIDILAKGSQEERKAILDRFGQN